MCQRWPNDDDWPTWDPHTLVFPGAKSAGDIARDFLRKRTVIFVGDSVNSLIVTAYECEVAKGGSLAQAFVPRGTPLGDRLNSFAMRVGSVPIDDWIAGDPVDISAYMDTETISARKGWHHYGEKDMAPLLELADVLVVNYALHYEADPDTSNPFKTYQSEMRKMFEQVSEFASTPGKAFVFRETFAEHDYFYDAVEEAVKPKEEQYTGCRCQNSDRKLHEVGRRNDAIQELLPEFPMIKFMPFYNVTLPATDLHEGIWCSWGVMKFETERGDVNPEEDRNPICCDCTHYCYTPQMWRNFFGTLYEVLDTVPGLKQ